MRKSLIILTFAVLPTVASATAAGDGPSEPDTDMLASVLSTAFLAKNLTLVCSQQDRWFAQDTKTESGDGIAFAQHIEGEVLTRLPAQKAGLVAYVAANAARSVSLGLVRVMSGEAEPEQSERIKAWCATTAKPLVTGILAQHEIRHDLYEQMLSTAKN